jgi:hypothetical protein
MLEPRKCGALLIRALLSRGLMTGKRSVFVSVSRSRVRVCIRLLTAPDFLGFANCRTRCPHARKEGLWPGLKVTPPFLSLQEGPLSRSSIRGHQSEIMFGVLVVVFCPDWVAALGFSLGERQIPVIVSSRVVRALWLWSGRTRCPPL